MMLDVDLAMGAPGSDIDDGFALALALADPGISLELVTTVNGNTDVATATTLTLELLHRLGHPDVPVHRGARDPLLRPRVRQGEVPAGVERREPRPGPAAMAMVDLVRANPGEITLVAVGPLTNVALAMRLDPTFAANLKSLVIMGGVFNQHTHALGMPGEYNVWCDPEAAAVVLGSGVVARWVGLDVTLKVRVTKEQAAQMEASGRAFASFAGRYTSAWIDHIVQRHPEEGESCAMHDPLAVAAVTHPDLLTWREAHVVVETGDRLRGAMVTDYLGSDWLPDGTTARPTANALVAQTVRADQFNQLFLDSMMEM
ncbi:nucleoside hydrolase [Desertihabitans brevis]|uniref:Nucleoside hydrolase n=1 Tax=Desertihabitans brevis TaxID=2268447 RepID=A0A367YUY0_9ACTN|nr:nucleoside hydrolase [Desertihabitans brevis]RCK68822.1 nucleoside hydrolase [Desertihabitans brevis]